MRMLRMITVADIFTMANLACGLIAIFLSILGAHAMAALMLPAAVLFDFLDGRVARLLKSGVLGKHLDSLADLVSFGVAPAVFGFTLGLDRAWHIAVLCLFVICGMLRLARFAAIEQRHFEGVPITVNGLLFPAAFAILWFLIDPVHYISLQPVLAILYLVMGLLMISGIRVPKI